MDHVVLNWRYIKPTKDEITPPNVTTVADEEGTDRQTDKLCLANEF